MKAIFRTAAAILIAVTSTSVFAENRMDMGVLAGYRINDASTDVAGASINGKGGFQVGGLAFIPMSGQLSVRTGFIYAMRNYESEVLGVKDDIKFSHFDVPATVMYNFTDLGGIFAGANLSLKVADDCGAGCDAKSMFVSLQFGGDFKIAPQFAAEFYFETAPSEIADGIKDATAVVINGLFTFE